MLICKKFIDFALFLIYNAYVKYSYGGNNMKKLLAVLLSVLVVFTTCSIAVMAEETVAPETTVAAEENTNRDIKNDEGLVVPLNFNQLKSSVIFKVFEKIISFILSLFGAETAPEIDNEAATAVGNLGDALDERLEDLFG